MKRYVIRRVIGYGWAAFDKRTDEKLIGDEFGPWSPTRSHAKTLADEHLDREARSARSGSDG